MGQVREVVERIENKQFMVNCVTGQAAQNLGPSEENPDKCQGQEVVRRAYAYPRS